MTISIYFHHQDPMAREAVLEQELIKSQAGRCGHCMRSASLSSIEISTLLHRRFKNNFKMQGS